MVAWQSCNLPECDPYSLSLTWKHHSAASSGHPSQGAIPLQTVWNFAPCELVFSGSSTHLPRSATMHCPVCKDHQLVMSERQGVEIDYCPSCRGVWLDRGELDKLIEKSSAMSAAPASQPQVLQQAQPLHQPPPQQAYQQPYPQRHDSKHYYQKKPKNWLSEFFD